MAVDRFLERATLNADGCLIYPTATDRYPQLWVGGKAIGMHRLALELHLARKLGLPSGRRLPLPPNVLVLHRASCPKACVLGSHVRTGTPGENLQDALLAGHRPVKLDPAAAQTIRQAPRTGPERQRLAERFGVTPEHVRAVPAGRCWAWAS